MLYDEFNNYGAVLSKHKNNVNQYFDNLVQQSQIDISGNRQNTKKVNALRLAISTSEKKIKKLTFGKKFFLSLGIIGFILFGLCNVYSFLRHRAITSANSPQQISLIVAYAALLPVAIGSILLTYLVFKRKIISMQLTKEKLEKSLEEKLKIGYDQTKPLLDLIDYDTLGIFIPQTLPFLNLDPNFRLARLYEMKEKFNFSDKSDNNTTICFTRSGTMMDYPFVVAKKLTMTMGTKMYHGQLTISWVSTTTINGKTYNNVKTQILHAHVIKPCPYYNYETAFYFAHDNTPKLSYSRTPSSINTVNLDEKSYYKFTKKLDKETDKSYRQIIKKNPGFQLLSNTEFEGLYQAFDRNNEVDYRILFTPLAQQQMLKLFKDRQNTYGDAYNIHKKSKITKVSADFLNDMHLYDKPEDYQSHDYDEIKNRFTSYNNTNFKSFYMGLAPVLAVPSYTTVVPVIEPPLQSIDKQNYSVFQHEEAAHAYNSSFHILEHSETATPAILKTSYISSNEQNDTVDVNAYSFKKVLRTDYVPVYGGDGMMHDVPVEWTEYIPLQKHSVIELEPYEKVKQYQIEEEKRNSPTNISYIHRLLVRLVARNK